MIKNLRGYIDHVRGNVWYWKYNPQIYYVKRTFKFSNTGTSGGGTATLTVYGDTPEFKRRTLRVKDYELFHSKDAHTNVTWPEWVTDAYKSAIQNGQEEFQVGWDIPSKRYRIYYELRTSNLDRWDVIIPVIDGGWDLLNNKREGDILPDSRHDYQSTDKYFGGLTYDPAYSHPNWPGYDSRVAYESWGLPPGLWTARNVTSGNATISYRDLTDATKSNSGYRYLFKYQSGVHYIPTALSRILNKELPAILQDTNEMPAFQLYNEKDDPYRTKFYDTVPVGVTKYTVTLTLPNGESVSGEF